MNLKSKKIFHYLQWSIIILLLLFAIYMVSRPQSQEIVLQHITEGLNCEGEQEDLPVCKLIDYCNSLTYPSDLHNSATACVDWNVDG